jgi:hypothetical protein
MRNCQECPYNEDLGAETVGSQGCGQQNCWLELIKKEESLSDES